MARENILCFFVLIISFNTVKSATIGKGLHDNEIKDSLHSNGEIFECFRDRDVLNCVWQRAGKFLEYLEQEENRQMKMLQKEADEKNTGRSLEEMPSQLGEDIERNLKSLAQTIVTITRSLGSSDDAVNTTSPVEDGPSKNGVVKESRQLNKKGNVYMMLIGVGSLFISKMMFFLNLIRLKLQFKFFLIALIALALNIARFIMEWQQKHMQLAHYTHPKIVYRDEEAIAGGYGGEEWKRTKDHVRDETWDDEDERYPYRGQDKLQHYNRIRTP